MRVAVTGAHGFLGWHARCALRAGGDHEVVPITRPQFADKDCLDRALSGADAVLHMAGVNRGPGDAPRSDNIVLGRLLVQSLDRVGARPAIVYANSIQSGDASPFGEGKATAAAELTEWATARGTTMTDVHLPNLFGEHGRPHYNSVVATFCHALTHGENPQVLQDRAVPLLHVQDAVEVMLAQLDHPSTGVLFPEGRETSVSGLLAKLRGFHDLYLTGDIPDISDPFDRAMFNTYRSFAFPDQFPIHPPLRSDQRGDLFEAVRDHGGRAHVFCSSTRPGFTRGEHFHLRKVERFLVLRGSGQIALRRLFDTSIVRFDVTGDHPAIVDMPTMWVHSITNTGTGELVTLFWADEILDPQRPDTYPEKVDCSCAAA